MSTGPVSTWVDRLVELAIGLVVAGLLLRWAWLLLRPALPVLLAGVVLLGFLRWQRR